MKTKQYLFITMIVFMCLACSHQAEYDQCKTFKNSDLSKLDKIFLQGKNITFDQDIQTPVKLKFLDSILILNNMNTSILLDKYNINSLTKNGSCIAFGSGPDEMLIINGIQQIDSTVWLFDQSQNKLFQFIKSDLIGSQNPNTIKTIKLDTPASNVSILSPDLIIATTLNPKGKRFTLFNGEGKSIKDISEYPNFGEQMTDYERIESFTCESALSEDNQNIILTYKQTDLLEIYDIEGNLKTRVQGPDHIFPALKQKNNGELIRVVPIQGMTYDAYFNPYIYKDEIYTLYSGKVFNPDIRNYLLNRIIVFNLSGEPIREYELSEPIFRFTINPASGNIYGISDNPEFHIIEFTPS